MNILKKYIYNEFYVKLSFIILTILYCIPIFMPIVDYLINLLFIWVLLIIANDVYTSKSIFRFKGSLLAYLFLSLFLCTIFYWSLEAVDIKIYIYMFVQLCFFMSIDRRKNIKKIKFEFIQLCKYIVILSIIIFIISIFLYFKGYCQIYRNNIITMELLVGRHPNSSLYGVLANSNWMSFLCITVIGLSQYLKKTYNKNGYIFPILLSFITLYLTNSRGGLVGCIVLFFFINIFYFISSIKFHKKQAILYFIMIPLSILLIIGGNFLTKKISTTIYHYTNLSQHVVPLNNNHSLSVQKQTNISRTVQQKKTSSNIRLDLLSAGTKVLKNNFIFGVGVANLGKHVFKEIPPNSSVNTLQLSSNIHNIYMQIAVASGGINFIVFLAFILYNISFVIIFIFTNINKNNFLICTILSLILAYLVINLVEADIFMSRNFMSCLFWIIFGYVIRLTELSNYDKERGI